MAPTLWGSATGSKICMDVATGRGLECCGLTCLNPYVRVYIRCRRDLPSSPIIAKTDLVSNCWVVPIRGIYPGEIGDGTVDFPVFLEWDGADLVLKTIDASDGSSKAHFRAVWTQQFSGTNWHEFEIKELGHDDYNSGDIATYTTSVSGCLSLASGPVQWIFGDGASPYEETACQWTWGRAKSVLDASTVQVTFPNYTCPYHSYTIPGVTRNYAINTTYITNATHLFESRGWYADGWAFGSGWERMPGGAFVSPYEIVYGRWAARLVWAFDPDSGNWDYHENYKSLTVVRGAVHVSYPIDWQFWFSHYHKNQLVGLRTATSWSSAVMDTARVRTWSSGWKTIDYVGSPVIVTLV